MTTTRYVVNNRPPQLLDRIDKKVDFEGIIQIKNLEYREVETNEFCTFVLDRMMSHVTSIRKHLYVFIHICTDGNSGLWHLDSSLNPIADYENFLFVAEENCTEFVRNPMIITHAENAIDFHRQVVAQQPSFEAIPPYTICRYDGSNVHRRPQFTSKEKRLLIRLSNTNMRHTRYGILKQEK